MNRLIGLLFAATLGAASFAQINVGSDGSDGALSTVNFENKTIETNEAAIVPWNSPAPIAGKGVYDSSQWAVVYKFTTINLAVNSQLRFSRHRTNAPIVILCTGAITLATGSSISVSATTFAGGNGGFDGGFTTISSVPNGAGFGPGGGNFSPTNVGMAGSFGSLGGGATTGIYGNSASFPLIGGSGGSGRTGVRGGGGGGAIIIASNTTINLGGTFSANGAETGFGCAAGAGGAIRLICNLLTGAGTISAIGGQATGVGATSGGNGRIRFEINSSSFTGNINPLPNSTSAEPVTTLFPSILHPTARITQVGSSVVGTDPSGNLILPDLNFTTGGPYTVQIVCTNVPTDGTWAVNLRLTPRNGQDSLLPCTLQSGNQAVSIWTVNLSLVEGLSALQVRAHRL